LHPCSDGVVALSPSPTIPSPRAAGAGESWTHLLLWEWEGDAQRCWHCSFSAVFTAARSKVHVAVDAVYRECVDVLVSMKLGYPVLAQGSADGDSYEIGKDLGKCIWD
ncbi:hypothetical protein Nmel_015355, partial [Mimus melanotis]